MLAQFRTRRSGVVVNVSSSVTLARMLPAAAYPASKAAIASNGGTRMAGLIPEAYAPFAEKVIAGFANPSAVTVESDVAKTVWRAANDVTGQLRFPAGADAIALAQSR